MRLRHAADESGIQGIDYRFPFKTRMRVEFYKVAVAEGYGARYRMIWSTTADAAREAAYEILAKDFSPYRKEMCENEPFDSPAMMSGVKDWDFTREVVRQAADEIDPELPLDEMTEALVQVGAEALGDGAPKGFETFY